MRGRIKVILGIVGFLLLLGVIGIIFSPSKTNDQTGKIVSENEPNPLENAEIITIKSKSKPSESAESLTILKYGLIYGEHGFVSIKGVAENTAGKQLSYAEVMAKFYGKNGALIGAFVDNIDGLDTREKWEFEVVTDLDGNDVKEYSIEVGTTW